LIKFLPGSFFSMAAKMASQVALSSPPEGRRATGTWTRDASDASMNLEKE
jgi:hypothetical protein